MSETDSTSKPKRRKRSGKKSQKISFDEEVVPKGTEADLTLKSKKRKKLGKKSQKISFDEEIVPKGIAQQLNNSDKSSSIESDSIKKPKYKTKQKIVENENSDSVNLESNRPKKHKRKKKSSQSEKKETNETTERVENLELSEEQPSEDAEVDPTNPVVKTEESKRAQQRKKHQQLLLEKKVKVDHVIQEKCLNYLSRWKHSRDLWKFEKLRQVWLQQNMFDCDRVPKRFWETLVEYFSGAKGQIRQTIINEALKFIKENEHEVEKNNEDEEKESEDGTINKAQRARYIIQCLRE